MARFTIAKRKGGKSAMRVINKKNLLAFFDVEDNDTGLLYRDFKLMDSKNGPFVSSPSGEPYQNKDGKDIYPDYVSAIYDADAKNNRNEMGDEFFKGILAVAEAEFDRLTDGGDDDEDDTPAPRTRRSAKGSSKSGSTAKASKKRPAPQPFEDEEDDDLPF